MTEQREPFHTEKEQVLATGLQVSRYVQVDDTGAAVAGAISVSPGVWLYQMTDDGLALELTAKGTKYYKDDDLN